MQINPIDNTRFGILKNYKKYTYDYKSFICMESGKFRDYDIKIRQDYKKGKLFSSLISINKAGRWVKSKLKYFENGKCVKTIYKGRIND